MAKTGVCVCVEGNVGCGKTSALEALARVRPDLAAFSDPERGEADDDLVARFGEEPGQWALPLALHRLLAFSTPLRAARQGCAVVERSPLSCRHVFSQLLFNDGKLAPEDWELFKEYCDLLGWTPDAMAYVHTPADECQRRVAQRGRGADGGVDLQYAKRLEFQYETMLRYADVPVVRIDGTQSAEHVALAIAEVVDRCTALRA